MRPSEFVVLDIDIGTRNSSSPSKLSRADLRLWFPHDVWWYELNRIKAGSIRLETRANKRCHLQTAKIPDYYQGEKMNSPPNLYIVILCQRCR